MKKPSSTPLGLICSTALICSLLFGSASTAQTITNQKEVSWALHYDPKTLDPAKVDDQASEIVRYLTAGVLIRLNRTSMALEPDLADRWQQSKDGRVLTLHLRQGLRFSDGSPLSAADVVSSLRRILAPATAAPVAEEFLEPAKVSVRSLDNQTVELRFPVRLNQAPAILDEIAIEPANRFTESRVTAGAYAVSDYSAGQFVRLRRNPYFWQKGTSGSAMPYLPSLKLDVLTNPDTEELRFMRGQYAVLDSVPPESFEALNRRVPGSTHDLGPSLNTEQMWFNQNASAPLPAYEKEWFTNTHFRMAVSLALHRKDMARIAFNGHATPANGFVSPANTTWYNRALPPVQEDAQAALRLLMKDGFQKHGAQLVDRAGHPVKFSLVTNAGNRARQRMAALIQQDLAGIGIQVNVVTLDFPALIDRLMHSSDYEAALLGLSNVQPDPSAMMNVWLSDSPNHQWNPNEKTPATPWEAEIDRLIRAQAEVGEQSARKADVDRLQEIVSTQLPFLFLVYPNTLCAASPSLQGVHFSVLQPNVVSEIQTISFKGEAR